MYVYIYIYIYIELLNEEPVSCFQNWLLLRSLRRRTCASHSAKEQSISSRHD